ncbi:MAG: hypothetical protein P1P84_24620 [Deferrisomatales bacterium]|nr:hypothetical protein [Deferrisomatales bacterium]
MEQLMSTPQHMGDLIFPWPFGHLEIRTAVPSGNFTLSSTRGASHFAHVALTPIPHFEHSYVAIFPTSRVLVGLPAILVRDGAARG